MEGRVLMAAAIAVSLGALAWLVWQGRALEAGLLIAAFGVMELAAMGAARLLSKKDGIIAIDETPRITEAMLDRFFEHGFDAELGWIRKPNTAKKDLGRYPYRIDERGSRANPGHEQLPLLISTYGDSYTFCREVEDHETWQWHLAEQTGSNVLNFGVGNYGLDQALLRFEREYPVNRTPVVVMGVVPNTIARILSVWKHYNEFGNLFAFKPRYVLEGGALRLMPNPVDARDKFFALETHLPAIQRDDYFYGARFRAEAMRRPYLLSMLANWRGVLLGPAKALRRLAVKAGLSEAPFAALVGRFDGGGPRQTASLFRDPDAVRLLQALAREFARRARAFGAQPVLLVMPMKDDVYFMKRRGHFYRDALDPLAADMAIVDAAPAFLAERDTRGLFREWHYSPRGNRLVADLVAPVVARFLHRGQAADAARAR